MAHDIIIEIFGHSNSGMNLTAVVESAEGDMLGIDPNHSYSAEEIAEDLLSTAERGDVFTLYHYETSDHAYDTRLACRDAGLPYVVSYRTTGAEEFQRAAFWRPGLGEEYETAIDVMRPMIAVAEVQAAVATGDLKTVRDLLIANDFRTLADLARTFSIGPDAAEDLRAYVEAAQAASL